MIMVADMFAYLYWPSHTLLSSSTLLTCVFLTVTEKHTTMVLRQKQFWVGLSDMQGWRISESTQPHDGADWNQVWKTPILSTCICHLEVPRLHQLTPLPSSPLVLPSQMLETRSVGLLLLASLMGTVDLLLPSSLVLRCTLVWQTRMRTVRKCLKMIERIVG